MVPGQEDVRRVRGGTKGPEGQLFPSAVIFLPDPDTRLALLHDPRAFVPASFGPNGWIGFDLTAAPMDWQEVAELVEESYRNTAPKRLVALLDAD